VASRMITKRSIYHCSSCRCTQCILLIMPWRWMLFQTLIARIKLDIYVLIQLKEEWRYKITN